jgi:hypothetical protein
MWSVQFNNALPNKGGLGQQIAVVMEALSVVRDEMHKVEEWKRHQQKIEEEKKRATGKHARNRGK